MYPNLYYLFKDLFGVEISILKIVQSFGFFVAMAFVVGSYLWSKEIKRRTDLGQFSPIITKRMVGKKGKITDYLSSILIGFLIGYKFGLLITDYDAFTANPQLMIISTQGNLIAGLLGLGIFTFWKYKEIKAQELPEPEFIEEAIPPETLVGNMVMIAAISGILGAKIFHLLENPDEIAAMFTSATSFFSGLTIYGGLIIGIISVLIYAKKKGLNIINLMDSGGPLLMLAYGIGRIGCQTAGDGDWGVDNLSSKPSSLSFLPDWMWSFKFPHNVNEVGIRIAGCEGPFCFELPNPVWPTPFYETIMSFIIFGFLWSIRDKIKTPGIIFSLYLIFNGIERFMIEKIRVNEHLFGTNITQAEIISSCFVILGLAGIVYFKKRSVSLL